jgi:microcystin-dependent protein
MFAAAGGTSTPYAPVTGGQPMNAASISTYGGSQPHENRQPFLVMNWVIALSGIFPSRN